MSHHLSEDQFARCAIGDGGKAELEHLRSCPSCNAELELFGNAVSAFRTAVRNRIDVHVPRQFAESPVSSIPTWRWAVVVALFVVAVSIPFFISAPKPPQVIQETTTEMDPDALMRAVNLHLSRTVPAPMEPVLALIPRDE